MSKRKKSRRHGVPQQRRTTRRLHAVPDQPVPAEQQELFQQLRAALRADHPLALLALVSSLISAVDARRRTPFGDADRPAVTLEELVDSFVGTDYAETTAALTVLRALVPDEVLAARIGKVLATRRQPMPGWLQQLGRPSVSRVVKMEHALGDGDDYFLDARLASGEPLTTLVYVDHNMGGAVKDAFCIPQPLAEVQEVFDTKIADADTTFTEIGPADARATIEKAIRHGVMMFPPLESEDWPMSRPLVEWLLRSLPEGGTAPEWVEIPERELEALHQDFLASPYGQDLDGEDERGLLGDITWFGSGWAGSDPLRWSPVNVEILMTDWFPRKIVAETSYLTKLPDVLRAFIRYCHARRGIRQGLTDETLAAVDHWEPEFQRQIRSSRSQGAQAIAELMLEEQRLRQDADDDAWILRHYDAVLGSRGALMNLDAEPLPDEDFDWSGIPEDIRQRVQEVLELCDRCADELFDVEHRTAFRRFLGRAAVGDPAIFRRKGAANRAAAAVCWAVAKANLSVGYAHGTRLESQELLGWFGVKSAVSDRAKVFLAAVGADPDQFGDMKLGSPDFLVSGRRAQIIEYRDEHLSR